MNPFNIAKALLDSLDSATKKADKDAIKAQLGWAANEIAKFDTSGLGPDERHFVSDVAERLATTLESK